VVTTHLASDGSEIGTTEAGGCTEVTVTGLKNGTPVYLDDPGGESEGTPMISNRTNDI
jgi:hypothetical protein